MIAPPSDVAALLGKRKIPEGLWEAREKAFSLIASLWPAAERLLALDKRRTEGYVRSEFMILDMTSNALRHASEAERTWQGWLRRSVHRRSDEVADYYKHRTELIEMYTSSLQGAFAERKAAKAAERTVIEERVRKVAKSAGAPDGWAEKVIAAQLGE